jgi:hypothetical protein
MVRNAHAMAANTEANWLRVEMVILKILPCSCSGSFRGCQGYCTGRANFKKNNKNKEMQIFAAR